MNNASFNEAKMNNLNFSAAHLQDADFTAILTSICQQTIFPLGI